MARERGDRFATAAEFMDALTGRTRVEPPAAPVLQAQRPRGSRRPLAVLIAVALAALGGVAVAAVLATSSEPTPVTREGPDLATPRPPVVALADAGTKAAPVPVPVPVAEEEIDVVVKTVPPDAEIRIDGAVVGNPVKLRRPRAEGVTMTIEISAEGYQPQTRTVALSEDVSLEVELDRRRAKTGPRTGGGLRVKGLDD
jgi:hypothetical protein